MRAVLVLVLVLVLALASCNPAGRSAATSSATALPTPRYRSPEEPVRAYFAASDRCSSELLRTAYHPAAHLVRVDDAGVLHSRTQLRWWQSVETPPCVPALDRQLTVLDREGPMAIVETTSRYTTRVFHDLLLVVETPSGWLVVDKVYDMLEPARTPPTWADDAAVRAVVGDKIRAALDHDPALLASTHLDDCVYSAVHTGAGPYARDTVSEWAARYAERRRLGVDGRTTRWTILRAHAAGKLAWAKLEVVTPDRRYIDHLALLRVADGWRIAAAVWGDPG